MLSGLNSKTEARQTHLMVPSSTVSPSITGVSLFRLITNFRLLGSHQDASSILLYVPKFTLLPFAWPCGGFPLLFSHNLTPQTEGLPHH